MQTNQIRENSALELKKHYESIRNRVGEQSAKEILLGAKNSLIGGISTNPGERRDFLELYQQVEKELFGQIQYLPGEKEMSRQKSE